MPSWPSRLIHAPSGTPSSHPPAPAPIVHDKPGPHTPAQHQAFVERPTLYPSQSQRTGPSPPRPGSSSSPQHIHHRSTSHPLPRLFGRKKSSGNIRVAPDDVPLDDALVPVLDQPPLSNPTKTVNGKGRADDDGNATKSCMCCDSKVRFPKGLKVFRCTSCLTINDLEIYQPRPKEWDGAEHTEQVIFPSPLSIARTRENIDRCLSAYLATRYPAEAETERGQPGIPANQQLAQDSNAGQSIKRPNVLQSHKPASAPPLHVAPSATIRDFTDFEQISFYGTGQPSQPPSLSGNRVPPVRSSSEHQASLGPAPGPPKRKPAPPPVDPHARAASVPLKQGHVPPPPLDVPHGRKGVSLPSITPQQERYERAKAIFKPLEDYINSTFGNYECLNASFSTVCPRTTGRTHSESAIKSLPAESPDGNGVGHDVISQLDAKTLLIGDFAENGSWWTGRVDRNRSGKSDSDRKKPVGRTRVTSKSPQIDWQELYEWYRLVHEAGRDWLERAALRDRQNGSQPSKPIFDPRVMRDIDADIAEARNHAQRALLKVTENLLKRPTRPLTQPDDVRFLFIILSNPSLYPHGLVGQTYSTPSAGINPVRTPSQAHDTTERFADAEGASPTNSRKITGKDPGQHTGILKRIFGLLAYSSESCHRYVISWCSRLAEDQFTNIVDLVASFVTYRLSRRPSRPRSKSQAHDGGLIPDLSGSAWNTSAQLHTATGLSGGTKKAEDTTQGVVDYSEDWQLKAAAKFMALLFTANNTWHGRITESPSDQPPERMKRPRAKMHGQLLPTSDFYNTLLDYHNLIDDFKVWESKRAKFTFCQYPFFLSMGSKIKIMEYDARRQMEIKAREAYFDQVTNRRAIDGFLHLRVRRDCMVDDSLRQISEAVGQGQEELKKGLRVHFAGEEGVDAGGLRKEWFLMLVRDIFDPNHGMFLYDDDSHTCYFNPNAFETSDQYYLVGALLGLAIYNSTILDVALPPFAYRKLLAATPTPTTTSPVPTVSTRGHMTYTLKDLAEYRPRLAAGLQQMLDYDGDVETTYCRDFVASVERYGTVTDVPLCPGGANKPVTNANRHEFVELYVRYLLDTAVARQFEPFKRGFFTVCAGNALSLFRAEEIELLVRGSDEALDVDSLRAVAVYENWRSANPPHNLIPSPADTVPVIQWFWDFFGSADPQDQRKLLSFITGSDRIPAVGATNLILKIQAGGDGTGRASDNDNERFPVARTCFNMLVLWPYSSRQQLQEKLWRAVLESEGFGLK